MAVSRKLYCFYLFLFLSLEVHMVILKTNQFEMLKQDRYLAKLSLKQKKLMQQRLKNCGTDQECVKFTLQKGLDYIKHTKALSRKLSGQSGDFMQIIFILLMIYLMFKQPFIAGMILFMGGLNGMFRKLVMRERRLNKISQPLYQVLNNQSRTKMNKIFMQERSKLFHYLLNNPITFKTLNKGRLLDVAKDYFDKVYRKNDQKFEKELQNGAEFVFAHKSLIDSFFKKKDTQK